MESRKLIYKQVKKALQTVTGLKMEIDRRSDKSVPEFTDFIVTINRPDNLSGSQGFFCAVVKTALNSTQISEFALRSKNTPHRTILLANQITTPQAEKMRGLDLCFCDAAGNTYLNTPHLYVFVTGRKTLVTKEKSSRLFGKTGLKILYALLTRAELAAKDFRLIAAASNVGSISTVSDIFKDLIKQRYLLQHGSAGRTLNRKAELLRRWTESYNERLRPTLNPVRFRSVKHNGRWWEDVDITEYNACWGGETGGALLTRHLKPAMATIYSDSLLPRLQAKYGLVRDERGKCRDFKEVLEERRN